MALAYSVGVPAVYKLKISPNFKQKLFCYYCSWVLFVRSFFLVERPKFLSFLGLVLPLLLLSLPVDASTALFINCRCWMAIGLYLMAIDSLGSMISQYIFSLPPSHYLHVFFKERFSSTLKGKYLSAGWSALLIGKTPMTATGRASIGVGLFTGGLFFYHNALQRAHETETAERARAYSNYEYARKKYDGNYFFKGEKPTWSESNYKKWSDV